MKKRSIWGVFGVLAALYLARAALKMAGEIKRYNHILSMSNEGTVFDETPELLVQIMKQERQTVKEWMNFMKSAPGDLARYMKIESM